MRADANGDRSVHMSKCVSVYLEKYHEFLLLLLLLLSRFSHNLNSVEIILYLYNRFPINLLSFIFFLKEQFS